MLKKILIALILGFIIFPIAVKANIICNDGEESPTCSNCHQGCCSHHGGCIKDNGDEVSDNSLLVIGGTIALGAIGTGVYIMNKKEN